MKNEIDSAFQAPEDLDLGESKSPRRAVRFLVSILKRIDSIPANPAYGPGAKVIPISKAPSYRPPDRWIEKNLPEQVE